MKKVFIDDLQEGMVLQEDVYASQKRALPYLTKGAILTENMINALRTQGISSVYVEGKAEIVRVEPVKSAPPTINPKLKKKALTNLEEIYSLAALGEDKLASAPKLIKKLDEVVEQLVDTLLKDKETLINIADLKSYDEYTYHHSLSVAVLSIAIGNEIGLSPQKLNLLGKCAMMHDIGKIAIPINIINKPSRLTEEEFTLVQNHAMAGSKYLIESQIGDQEMWQGVMFHHEKFDGTGYPQGLSGNQIPLMSRIISVADVYDALTSHRPYRKPASCMETIEYVMGSAGTAFDFDLVMAFVKKLDLYPVGSIVLLSNGAKAVVVNNDHTLRPVIRILDTGEELDLYWNHNYLNLTITSV